MTLFGFQDAGHMNAGNVKMCSGSRRMPSQIHPSHPHTDTGSGRQLLTQYSIFRHPVAMFSVKFQPSLSLVQIGLQVATWTWSGCLCLW